MAEPPVVVVPSATITQLGLHFGSGETSGFARKRISKHPEWLLDDDEKVDWSKFRGSVLDASHSTLPTLSPIATSAPTFACLTVLCLRESGVVDIELLQPCAMLVHLDLSSNEIVHLVGGDFWASFRDLLVLLLHGNKVMEWRAVGGLGKAPKLTYLTLFFNPVCKRKMYRPFTSNCCESLRGLDLHVVSDEEVVEGANFFEASRFRACSSALALPQPLFRGLTETLSPTQHDIHDNDHHPVLRASDSDTAILARVRRRVQLLRKFHAQNSPVIIGQRQIRRFLGERFGVSIAVKTQTAVRIQTAVRKWLVEIRSAAALKDILRESGELYLIQEMMTPMQLNSLAWFQRSIAGHFRLKVLITCAKVIERFMRRVAKEFSAFVDSLGAAQVGGVVVGQDQSGELAAAVARALVVATPGLTWVEAAERTATMVTIVPHCRLVRPFTYVLEMDWPVLEKDVDTDGVFVTTCCRSAAGIGSSAPARGEIGPRTPEATGAVAKPRPLSGLREVPARSRAPRRRMGLFGSPRMTQCNVSRRSSAARMFRRHAATSTRHRTSTAGREQLWVFRPLQARMLARVVSTLRNGTVRQPPVPFVLERHLIRLASATRIQAAWRGRVLRWVLLDTLASCIIVARAGICIQRWWRHQRGLSARLRLCRRLWALATDVSSPTMYVELDVFFALTRGWRVARSEESVVFTFQDGDEVAVVRSTGGLPFDALDSEAIKHVGQGETRTRERHHGDDSSGKQTPATRELPLWALGSVVPQVPPSEVHPGEALSELGTLLTVGVKVKMVVWPLTPAVTSTVEPADAITGGVNDGVVIKTSPPQLDRNRETSSDSFSTIIRLASARSEEVGGQAHPSASAQQRTAPAVAGPPVDLGASHRGEVKLLELTFSSVEEARARAVLLAVGTEEPGVRPNRPAAQLMTLEMLRRAAAGGLGRAAPTLKTPAHGFRRGDAVEVSVFRLSEGRGGAWFPAIVDRKEGRTYQVTLENGLGGHRVPEGSTRPRDCTGKEPELVEMSRLPSRWQRDLRSRLTPADRLELELLRRSLPATNPAEPLPDGTCSPVQLLSGKPPQREEADALFAPPYDDYDDSRQQQFDGLDGRGLVPVKPRPISPGSPLGLSGRGALAPSPPRWTSSQTMAAVRTAGGLAAEAMEKVVRAAAAADEAATPSTWVPGNRFRMGLEKLVRQDAHEQQDAAERAGLSARRDTVSRARQAKRAEPSPRDRLERLKAAEAAIFRRESDEINHRAAFEKAMHDHELKLNAVGAREHMRESRKQVVEALETELAIKMADSRRRESEAEGERRRSLQKRQADVQAAKAWAAKMRDGRTKQALSIAESRAFAANASQLARHVGNHTTTSYKAQTARGMRQWVKGQKLHEEDMRRRMLRRVQELQEQKRNEGTRLRKVLAARGRARAAIDDAVIHHRAGHAVPPGDDNLEEEIMHVLRPGSRLHGADGGQGHGEPGPHSREEDDEGGGGGGANGAHHAGGIPDGTQRQNAAETRHAMMEHSRSRRRGSTPGDGSTTPTTTRGRRRRAIPCKPEAARPRSREQRNRRLSAGGGGGGGDGGKTVVVLASVPRVARETRPTKPPPPQRAALLGSPNKEAVRVAPDQGVLPWPLGRRCW